jgi:hypothetical protein
MDICLSFLSWLSTVVGSGDVSRNAFTSDIYLTTTCSFLSFKNCFNDTKL